jgi:transcriptional regulator with XRE-family HTH domain
MGIPEKPSEAFARQLKFSRERRRWHQQDLADRLRELGSPTDRATIAKIENGTKKRILLDEALMLAAALGVNPLHLITPREAGSAVRLAPKLERDSDEVRSWFVGMGALFEGDRKTYEEEVSDDEREQRQNPRTQLFLDAMRPLVDALIAGDRERANELWGQVLTTATLIHPDAKPSVRSPTVTSSKPAKKPARRRK